MNAALSAIGRNINQIAKRVNTGGGAYKADMREIQAVSYTHLLCILASAKRK